MTMTLVQTVIVASNFSGLTFTNIPQTGTDLLIVASLRTDSNVSNAIRINGSAVSYTKRTLWGNGASVGSNNSTAANDDFVISTTSDTANTFGNTSIYIPNYTAATSKSFSIDSVSENNAATAWQYLTAGVWANTAAVTSISFDDVSYYAGSTVSLYTITKGSGGAIVS